MRKKLPAEDKRSQHIGIKVKKVTKQKLELIADREDRPLSTQIDIILTDYVEKYLAENKINWSEYAHQEEGGE